MAKLRITKRDIFFFILGLLAFLVFEILYDWETHKTAFREGRENAKQSSSIDN